jgi:hypothetical protein
MKKETPEEAAEKRIPTSSKIWDLTETRRNDFIAGAKWQQQQGKKMYSEEEVEVIIQKLMNDVHCGDLCHGDNVIDFKISPRQWLNNLNNK